MERNLKGKEKMEVLHQKRRKGSGCTRNGCMRQMEEEGTDLRRQSQQWQLGQKKRKRKKPYQNIINSY